MTLFNDIHTHTVKSNGIYRTLLLLKNLWECRQLIAFTWKSRCRKHVDNPSSFVHGCVYNPEKYNCAQYHKHLSTDL